MRLTFPNVVGNINVYMDCLQAICGDTTGKSMVDLMCCFAPNTPKLGFKYRRYFDIIDRKLDYPDEQQYFEKYDVLNYWFPDVSKYDVAICSDGIEHFYPDDGKKLINVMQQISHKQIIFTPLGEIFKLHNTGADDPEAHHSLWTPDNFPGWATLVFPDYHKVWNGGAFWAFKCEDTQEEYNRVYLELLKKDWFKNFKVG
jgi:hypothetical protein